MKAITQTELNQDLLAEVVAESLVKVATAPNAARWTNAIAKATVQLETNPHMTFRHDAHSLLILSPESGAVYEANGTCQCRAFKQGHPCWHRAAAKLVINYLQRTQ